MALLKLTNNTVTCQYGDHKNMVMQNKKENIGNVCSVLQALHKWIKATFSVMRLIHSKMGYGLDKFLLIPS